MRQFTRYSTDIPINIDVQSAEPVEYKGCQMTSISLGGLCCDVNTGLDVGCAVNINIMSVLPTYKGKATVSWCRPKSDKFEIGLRFVEYNDALVSRMVQQVCQIEHYKNIVFDREGKVLDSTQAAEQWVKKHNS